MKKILLIIGIAAFSPAFAQQKELFNIDTYLQKTYKAKKLPKALVIPTGKESSLIANQFYFQGPNLSHISSNGDKVYILGQDKMPCVVPDMSQFNMPNISNPTDYFKSLAFQQTLPGTIPNAVRPNRLILSK